MKTYPDLIIKNKTHKPNHSSNQKRRGCGEKSPLQAHKLNQLLGNGPSLDVVSVGIADPVQEMDGVGVAQVPLKHLKHLLLCLENLVLSVSIFSMAKKLCDRQCDGLLKL